MIHLLRTCGMAVSVLVVLTGFWREAGAQVIADHAAVAQFDSIPQEWIDSVKCMLLILPGESHGRGYHYGMDLLEAQDSKYASNVTWSGAAETYTTSHLRSTRTYRFGGSWSTSCGEEDYWTNETARQNCRTGLTYTRANYTGKIATGFGWCWDMTWHDWRGWVSIINGEDPVYGCHWDGCTVDGPQGITRWGLDAEDSLLTGNSVCMQTYIDAVAGYNAHEPGIVSMFTTGPVDGQHGNENGYQRWLKHEYLRNYVRTNGGYLFDYADILCWDSGVQYMDSWDGHDFQNGDADLASGGSGYDGGDGGCHITEAGCLALAKGMWWMLARIAGWDGSCGGSTVPVLMPESRLSGTAADGTVTVSPNPFRNSVAITLPAGSVPGTAVRIYAHDGTFITSLSVAQDGTVRWHATGALPGLYHYAYGNGTVRGSIIKMK